MRCSQLFNRMSVSSDRALGWSMLSTYPQPKIWSHHSGRSALSCDGQCCRNTLVVVSLDASLIILAVVPIYMNHCLVLASQVR